MTINFTLNVILLIVGIVVGIIAAFSLFIIQSNKQANKYLAALVLVCVGTLFHNFLIATGIYNQKPQLYFLPVILSLGIGPLLYLFINRLIFLKPVSRKSIFLHLLPLLIQFLFYSICFLQNANTKYEIYSGYYQTFINPAQILSTYISVAVYIYMSFKEITYYKQQLNDFYSNTDKIELQWLKKLLYVFMFYYILAIVFILISYSFNISQNYFPSDFIRCIIVFTIAVYAVNQTTLSRVQQNIQTIIADPLNNIIEINEKERDYVETKEEVKIEKPKEINSELLSKIVETVEADKLYLNEELTIADLAKKLGYSTKTISYTINNGLQKSVSLFINEYRVNLFKERKSSGKYEHLSIMGLAYDCGFNSKSTFNRIYKEITGFAPKEQKIQE